MDYLQDAVVSALEDGPMTYAELAEALGRSRISIAACVSKLRRYGIVAEATDGSVRDPQAPKRWRLA